MKKGKKSIPEGKISSYGQIASFAGIPRGHRVVARFLREQTDYPDLPWFRILLADGKISFPEGSQHFHTQKEKLLAEGVIVRNNRVNISLYRWEPDLDFFLFHPYL